MNNKDNRKVLAANPSLEDEIRRQAENGEISCPKAMQIATKFGEPTLDLGQRFDEMKIRIVQCQLGLFGCLSGNKIVEPAPEVSSELAEEIRQAIRGNYLPCKEVWAIAARRKLPKMAVSSACETLKIKIKPCQLGAF
jgi:hypothetical protein